MRWCNFPRFYNLCGIVSCKCLDERWWNFKAGSGEYIFPVSCLRDRLPSVGLHGCCRSLPTELFYSTLFYTHICMKWMPFQKIFCLRCSKMKKKPKHLSYKQVTGVEFQNFQIPSLNTSISKPFSCQSVKKTRTSSSWSCLKEQIKSSKSECFLLVAVYTETEEHIFPLHS